MLKKTYLETMKKKTNCQIVGKKKVRKLIEGLERFVLGSKNLEIGKMANNNIFIFLSLPSSCSTQPKKSNTPGPWLMLFFRSGKNPQEPNPQQIISNQNRMSEGIPSLM